MSRYHIAPAQFPPFPECVVVKQEPGGNGENIAMFYDVNDAQQFIKLLEADEARLEKTTSEDKAATDGKAGPAFSKVQAALPSRAQAVGKIPGRA
jgi:hypothetical protein